MDIALRETSKARANPSTVSRPPTIAIESLNSTVRRAVKARGHFPSDRAAMKLIYLALRGVERKWKRAPSHWHAARSEFAIRFGDRFRLESG